MSIEDTLKQITPTVRELSEVLRSVGVSSFEVHLPGEGTTLRLMFLPAAPAAQPSTPEQTGNTGAPAADPPKTPDVFDVIASQRAPGAPGPDGLPVPASGAG